MHLLDDPIGAALGTRHSSLALTDAGAVRYPADVAPFASLGPEPTDDAWAGLARLTPTGDVAMFTTGGVEPGPGWRVRQRIGLTQMTDDDVSVPDSPFEGAQDLGAADVPEMLRLTALTAPGPFESRTIEFGGYRGIVSPEWKLLSMAGRRMAPTGWVEVSAVCTGPEARGRGLARGLVLDVLRGIRAQGDRAFLHVAEGNAARGLYESMGFVARAELEVAVLARIR